MRTYTAMILCFVLTSVAQAQFLVRDQFYRCPPKDVECLKTHKLSATEFGFSTEWHNPYTINYVEFNDQSQLFKPKELDDAIAQIAAAEDGGKQSPLVIVYIHGWQNNANEGGVGSGDVVNFRSLMSRLADEYPRGIADKAPQVVGVFLAWRGLMSTVEPFKHIFSYWPRRQVAKREGQIGMHSAICRVEAAISGYRQNTFLILAGHSFGARVLENAIEESDPSSQCTTMKDYFDGLIKAKSGHLTGIAKIHHPGIALASASTVLRLPNLPADLIIYVNAATSSEKTRERIAQIKKICGNPASAYICTADPLYISFTSTNDIATGLVMPIANFVFPDFKTDRLHFLSAADSPTMHTHRAPVRGCPPSDDKTCFVINDNKNGSVIYHLPSISSRLEVPGNDSYPFGANPFWIFNVHSNLINGHGDVWNSNVENMLTVILKNNGRYQEVKRTASRASAQ